MKHTIRFLILAACIPLYSTLAPAAEGSSTRGGGDLCQNRIEEIRNDIGVWIAASENPGAGSAQLDFSRAHDRGVDLQFYNKAMLDVIMRTRSDGQASISCTNDQKLVQVEGKDKVCVAYQEGSKPRILCYRGRAEGGRYTDGFLGASQDEQYFQVHHELAVLAGLEDINGQETNYPFSSQISGLLEDQVVRKLAIRKPAPTPRDPGRQPLLAEIARDVWNGLRKANTLVPSAVRATGGARSSQGLIQVTLKTQLSRDGGPADLIPLWLSIAFDPAHPGELAYARLRTAAIEGVSRWAGGELRLNIGDAALTVGLDGDTRTRISRLGFAGIDVRQYVDITEDGQVELYVHGAVNITTSLDSMRTLDLHDDKDALMLGETGFRLLKKILVRGGGRITSFHSEDETTLKGDASAWQAGVDYEVSDRVRVTTDLTRMKTSGLDNNEGRTSVFGAMGGLTVEF